LQPDIVAAAGDRALDPGVQQLFEGGKQDALKLDGQRQQPVEKGGDRRQIVLDAGRIHQLQAGGGFEAVERAAFDLAADQQEIELAQRVAGIMALQIVLGSEEALSASLALSARDRAECIETSGDGGEKTLLGL